MKGNTLSDDKRRNIIIGTGRSGSSLLAAIMADAGADFNMPHRTQWNREGGAYEHPLMTNAYNWFSRADKYDKTLLPYRLVQYCRRRARASLRELFNDTYFVKYPIGIRMVFEIRGQGFHPSIIISYRNFDSYVISMWRRRGFFMTDLIDIYVDTYKTALLQMRNYGGCAIDYADIVNPEETKWIDAIAELTGLDKQKLITARDNRLREVRVTDDTPAYWDDVMAMDERPQQIYSIMKSLNGQVISSLE